MFDSFSRYQHISVPCICSLFSLCIFFQRITLSWSLEEVLSSITVIMMDDVDTYTIVDELLTFLDQQSEESVERTSSWSEEDSEEMNSEVTVVVAKKKRRRKYIPRRRLAPPKVVRLDIRRYYSQMFTNVCNSHDPTLMLSFFETYAAADLRMLHSAKCSHTGEKLVSNYLSSTLSTENDSKRSPVYTSNEYNLFKPLKMSARGIVCMASVRMQLFPDSMSRVVNTQVITRGDSDEAEIIVDSIDYSTGIFEVPFEDLVLDMVVASTKLSQQLGADECKSSVLEDDVLGDLPYILSQTYNSSSYDMNCGESKRPVLGLTTRRRVVRDDQLRVPDVFNYYQKMHGQPIKLLEKPFHIIVPMRLSIKVNANRQITAFEVLGKQPKITSE